MTELTPDAEEARLLSILNDEWWQKRAPSRGVKNTSIEEARLTKSGVVTKLLLDRDMTMERLERMLPQIRTLLDIQDEHQTDLLEGGRASKVALAIRTRRVTDTMDMTWRPGIETLGVDTVTGKEVDIPHDYRLLIAGASGSGKSWATRPLMARSVVRPDREVILIDGKGEEATVWCDVCRTAVEPYEIIELIDELHDDMWRRKNILKRHGLSVWDTRLGPEREIFVDEGRVVLAILSLHDKGIGKPEEGEEPITPSLQKLIDLSSLGRSRGIVLNWATQYPTTSGQNPGIDPQININVDVRFCLRVKSEQQARVILDDDANYGPQNIPTRKEMRGHGYKGEHGPTLVRTWTVTDETVRSLKDYGRSGADLPPSPPPVIDDGLVRQMLGTSEMLTAAQIASQHGGDAKAVAKILTDLMVRGEIGSRWLNGRIHYGKSLRF